jgi:hypothetical protein
MLAGADCLQRQRHVQVVRQRVVDGLDLRIGEQLAVGAEREAMARTSTSLLASIAGTTFCVPIFAVLSTPQTTFFTITSIPTADAEWKSDR